MKDQIASFGAHCIIVDLFANSIAVGDKIAAAHWLKFTIGEILDDHEVPLIMDKVTGKAFRPNLLLSSKSMGRGMGRQIREMAAIMDISECVESYRLGIKLTSITFE
jgi:hypothetical protein